MPGRIESACRRDSAGVLDLTGWVSSDISNGSGSPTPCSHVKAVSCGHFLPVNATFS